MGMSQGFRVDDRDARRVIARMRSEHPFALAYALTKTAQDIKAAEIDVMKNVFDRPTRFTLNVLFLKPATKTDLAGCLVLVCDRLQSRGGRMVDAGQAFPSINSMSPVAQNPDGSHDLYFGPQLPSGVRESNWIKTVRS